MLFLNILKSSELIERTYFIKKSKFVTYILKIENKEKLDTFLKEKIDKSATHNCFAYRLGVENLTFGYNNDGEPSGTVGEPLLKLVEVNNLTNIVIFVKRYYGGIKLGKGGLQKAYSFSSIEILKESELKKLELLYSTKIIFNLSDSKQVSQFLNKKAIEINFGYFDDKVSAEFKIDKIEKLEPIKNKIEIKQSKINYY